jgi:hypothetical protein
MILGYKPFFIQTMKNNEQKDEFRATYPLRAIFPAKNLAINCDVCVSVSVSELMVTASQRHVIPLQGRPYEEDQVSLNKNITTSLNVYSGFLHFAVMVFTLLTD